MKLRPVTGDVVNQAVVLMRTAGHPIDRAAEILSVLPDELAAALLWDLAERVAP